VKLRHDPNPAERPTATEVAFTTDAGVKFSVIGSTDRGDRVREVTAHLDVLVENMIPRRGTQHDDAPVGVTSLGDYGRLGDPSRLGAHVEGTVVASCYVQRQRRARVRTP